MNVRWWLLFAVAALAHTGAFFAINTAVMTHAKEEPQHRTLWICISTGLSVLGYASSYAASRARSYRRLAPTLCAEVATLYAPYHFLQPSHGNLTQEELLLFITFFGAVAYYVLWAICGLTRSGWSCLRAMLASSRRGRHRRPAIAFVMITLMVTCSVARLLVETWALSGGVAGFVNRLFLPFGVDWDVGALGTHVKVCSRASALKRPLLWQAVAPRRFFSFHMGPEYCDDQVPSALSDDGASRTVPLPQTLTPAMSYLDEASGLLYVADTCPEHESVAPLVVAVDTRTNMLAHVPTLPLDERTRYDVTPHHVAWMNEVRQTYGYSSVNRFSPVSSGAPALAGHAGREWVRAQWQVAVQGQLFTVSSGRALAQIAGGLEDVSDLDVSYDTFTNITVLPPALLNSDIRRFAQSRRKLRVFTLITAHTMVRCGSLEEHHAYPVAIRGPTRHVEEDAAKANATAGRRVVVLVLDSVSRLSVTLLPRTLQWLRAKRRAGLTNTSRPQVFEFPGFTAVGHSTQHNLCSYLSGMHGKLDEHLLPENNIFEALSARAVMRQAEAPSQRPPPTFTQVVSGICSDAVANMLHINGRYGDAALGTGFGGPAGPIDDYLTSLHCHQDYGMLFSNFKGPYSMRRRCLGRTPEARVTLSYARSSYQLRRRRHPDVGLFQMSLLLTAHEGTRSVLTSLDDDLVEHLNALEAMGVLDESALFVISDHGPHMGPWFETTTSGRIERALPLMIMLLSPAVAAAINISDVSRTERVAPIAAYDLHATWRDLLGLPHVTLPAGASFPYIGQSLLRPFTPYANCIVAGARDDHCIQDLLCHSPTAPRPSMP